MRFIFAYNQCPRTVAAVKRNPHISTKRPDARMFTPFSEKKKLPGRGGGGIQAREPSLSFSSLSFHETIYQKFAVIQTHLISFSLFTRRLLSLTFRNTSSHTIAHWLRERPLFTHESVIQLVREMTATFDREKKIKSNNS